MAILKSRGFHADCLSRLALMLSIMEAAIRFLKRLLWWLWATMCWIWEANPFWGPFIVAVVACLLVTVVSPCPVEREVRLIGMVLKLLGVVTIVMRLQATRRQFPGQLLKLWWRGRPQLRVRDRIVSATGTVTSVATVHAEARVSLGPQATVEQRLAMLEVSHTKLADKVGDLGKEVKSQTDELSSKLTAEAASRGAGDKRIEGQVREAAVGSLHLDAWRNSFSGDSCVDWGQVVRLTRRRQSTTYCGITKRPPKSV
jgi:hypothetical protein